MERVKLYFTANNIAADKQVPALLSMVGPKTYGLIRNLVAPDEPSGKSLVNITDIMKTHLCPEPITIAERFRFYRRVQGSDEPIKGYVAELKSLSSTCKFGGFLNEALRDKFVCGLRDQNVQKKLLSMKDLTFNKALEEAISMEIASRDAVELHTDTHPVHALKSSQEARPKKPWQNRKPPSHKTTRGPQPPERCNKCGYQRHKPHEVCPALGKTCIKCRGKDHFISCCHKAKSKVHAIEETKEEEEEFYIATVDTEDVYEVTECESPDEAWVTVTMQDQCVKLKIDTGAKINVMPVELYNSLCGDRALNTSRVKASAYGGSSLKVLGKDTIDCNYKGETFPVEFQILQEYGCPVLSCKTSHDMGLVKLVLAVEETADSAKAIIEEYEEIFSGIGNMTEPYKIQLESGAVPVVHPPRRVPVALRDKVKAELERMEKANIIQKVDEPTGWVNSMVVVPKPNGKVRICLDPRDLNKVIKREHYQMPVLQDALCGLSGCKYFTVLDAASAYWQIPLDLESSLLTTFNTPFGRYRYKRMPYGINSAQEVFQKRMHRTFQNVDPMVDDILIGGKTVPEHNAKLRSTLQTAKEKGVRFNPEKTQLCQTEVQFFGEVLSKDGMRPDPEKVKAVKEMKSPSSKKELESYMGMFTYLAQYAPQLAEKSANIRELLKKDNEWCWTPEHERDFQEMKKMIITDPVLQFYDLSKPVVVQVDASQNGLGAVLLQDGKPVAFASKSLTSAQRAYAQIEKEALAILFGCEKFHHYVYGREFVVESDHKPLETIMAKPLHAVPMRLQRMRIRLQSYDFKVRYTPGKDIPVADALSRHFSDEEYVDDMEAELDAHVHMVLDNIPMSDVRLEEVRRECAKDEQLCVLADYIMYGWPERKMQANSQVHEYWNFRDELSMAEGYFFKGEKLIIPRKLRNDMLMRLHIGHMGIEKTTSPARDIMFWPGMTRDIYDMTVMCDICQERQSANPKEPLKSHEIPQSPWEVVGTDLFEWNGCKYLVLVDYYSRYFEVDKLNDTKATGVIHKLKNIFARHGIPLKVISDNGPQYACAEFKDFANSWGFQHVTSSPLYPQSNGLAEKTVQTVKRILDKSKASGRDPYMAILEYRNMPVDHHASPAQMLMSRRLRSIVPMTESQRKPKVISRHEVIMHRQKEQSRQQVYYDKGAKPLIPMSQGDSVRIHWNQSWKPATVTERVADRSYVVQTKDGGEYRRNRRDLRFNEQGPETPEVIPAHVTPAQEHQETAGQDRMTCTPRKSVTSQQHPAASPSKDISVAPQPSPSVKTAPGTVVTRSGRTVKPTSYPDYVR